MAEMSNFLMGISVMEHCLGPRLIVLVFQAWRTHLSSLGDPAGLPLCNTAVSAFKSKSKSGKSEKKKTNPNQ